MVSSDCNKDMAKARPFSAVRKQLTAILQCAICHELPNRPKSLPCQHTFCQRCLVQHRNAAESEGEPFTCPLCKEEVDLSPGGIDQLPTDRKVQQLKEQLDRVKPPSADKDSQVHTELAAKLHDLIVSQDIKAVTEYLTSIDQDLKKVIAEILIENESALTAAYKTGNAELLECILKESCPNIEQVTTCDTPLGTSNATLLMVASFDNNEEMVSLLLEHDADVNAEDQTFGLTPVHAAVHKALVNIIKLLCEHGANVNTPDVNGISCLITAVGQVHVVDYLLSSTYVDIENVDSSNRTALSYAIEKKCIYSLHRLHEHGASWIANYDGSKNCLMAVACDADLCKSMADDCSFNSVILFETDSDNMTILNHAVKLGNQESVSFLLEHGADPFHENNDNEDCFLISLLNHDVNMQNMLITWHINHKEVLRVQIASDEDSVEVTEEDEAVEDTGDIGFDDPYDIWHDPDNFGDQEHNEKSNSSDDTEIIYASEGNDNLDQDQVPEIVHALGENDVEATEDGESMKDTGRFDDAISNDPDNTGDQECDEKSNSNDNQETLSASEENDNLDQDQAPEIVHEYQTEQAQLFESGQECQQSHQDLINEELYMVQAHDNRDHTCAPTVRPGTGPPTVHPPRLATPVLKRARSALCIIS